MTQARPSHDAGTQRSDSAPRPSNLGLLGARAAIVLDQRARGETAPVNAVNEFGNALLAILVLDRTRPEQSAEPSPESREKHRLWPLNTAALFQKALISGQGHEAQSFDQLMSLARETALELARVDDTIPAQKSMELRDVCLAISREAQAQRAQARMPVSQRPRR